MIDVKRELLNQLDINHRRSREARQKVLDYLESHPWQLKRNWIRYLAVGGNLSDLSNDELLLILRDQEHEVQYFRPRER